MVPNGEYDEGGEEATLVVVTLEDDEGGEGRLVEVDVKVAPVKPLR